MPECHTCQWDGKGRRVCLSCKLDVKNRHGKHIVSLDALDGDQRAVVADDDLPPAAMDLLRRGFERVILAYMRLRPADRNLVAWRFLNPDEPLYRYPGGASEQAVHARLKRAVADWPVLSYVLNVRSWGGTKQLDA